MAQTQSRQERRKQRTRQKLLDAARRVIATRGYEATGVLDITEEADVSKGTFYQYFTDKEDLTRTLIMEGLDGLRARVDAMMAGETEQAPEIMRQVLHTVFNYTVDNRDLFRIMLGRHATAELNMLTLDYYTKVAEEMLERYGGAIKEGYPPMLLAQFIAGAVVRLGMWWLENDHGLSPDEISEITYRLLREGVLRDRL